MPESGRGSHKGDVVSDYGQQKTSWRGHRFNRRSVAALNEVERRLGYELHISQGSYNTSVSASANTHAGGGAVDCVGRGDWAHEVRVMREVGWVAWHRTRPTFSSEHIHAILRGDPDMHEQARDQVREWEINGDGLVGSSPDTGPRIEIPVFPLRILPPPPGVPAARQLPGIDLSSAQAAFVRGMAGPPARSVKRIQRALNAKLGTSLQVDGLAGDITKRAYRAWQESLGFGGSDASGIPGKTSLTILGKRRWRVVS